MEDYLHIATDQLEIGYLEWQAQDPHHAGCAILLHGWPDSPASWKDVAPRLAAAGYRVLAPALRGFAPTRFRHATTMRWGAICWTSSTSSTCSSRC